MSTDNSAYIRHFLPEAPTSPVLSVRIRPALQQIVTSHFPTTIS